jgi:hypothetical protein
METFTDQVPDGWTINTDDLLARSTAQGNVHSGASSVTLRDGAVLRQEVTIGSGCSYRFHFFALGNGAQVGVTAVVNFLDSEGTATNGLTITVQQQDMPTASGNFAYYSGITTAAPDGTVAAEIVFTVTASGSQSMDLDDVSFTLA